MNSNQFCTCIQKICNGDYSGLELIYKEYYSKMKIKAYSITRQTEAAEDIASDFIKYIGENADKLFKINHPDAWISQSIRNNSLAYIKSNNKYIPYDVNNVVLTANDKNPELKMDFYKILDTLSSTEKDIFTNHYLFGYKYKELSTMLDIPINTIKWKISTIKEKFIELKKYL